MMYGDRIFRDRMPFMDGRGFGLWDLIILAGVVLIVVAIILYVRSQKKTPSSGHDALRILDERYARGDITEEEYLRKKEILRK